MWWSERRRALRALAGLAALGGAAAAGCGFQLRQPLRFGFGSIALTGFAPRSPLEAELRTALLPRVRVVDDPARAEIVLHALSDARERGVVASTTAAQVREMQLRVKFNFRVNTPGGRELVPRVDLLLTRSLSYTETQALAKQDESVELYREMQSDVVSQVLRRLAAVEL